LAYLVKKPETAMGRVGEIAKRTELFSGTQSKSPFPKYVKVESACIDQIPKDLWSIQAKATEISLKE
jgi:hypothetical protein